MGRIDFRGIIMPINVLFQRYDDRLVFKERNVVLDQFDALCGPDGFFDFEHDGV